MNKTVKTLLIIWIILAILNIVSLFKISTFLIILNHFFGFFNIWIVIALLPQIFRGKPNAGEWDEVELYKKAEKGEE